MFNTPSHPYTRGLLRCIPQPGKTERGSTLGTIPGIVPSLIGDVEGCAFRTRCPYAEDACRGEIPRARTDRMPSAAFTPTANATPKRRRSHDRRTDPAILELRGVTKTYRVKQGLFGTARPLMAVNDVSLSLPRGEVLGLVGESGCGKSTLAKILLGLETPTAGQVLVDGEEIKAQDRMTLARRIQPIFQDPYSSLNPRKSIFDIVSLPLRVHGIGDRAHWDAEVRKILDIVGLPARVMNTFPNQMSGGQRQRVAIARALIMKPEIVICDEPTSALDVSVQSQILNLLGDLRHEFGLSYLFISHDLAVVEHLATRVAVMYLGRIVEEADVAGCSTRPHTPTRRRC